MYILKEVAPKDFRLFNIYDNADKRYRKEPKYKQLEYLVIPYFRFKITYSKVANNKIEKVFFIDETMQDFDSHDFFDIVTSIIRHYGIIAYRNPSLSDVKQAYIDRDKYVVPLTFKFPVGYECNLEDVSHYGLSDYSFKEVDFFIKRVISANKILFDSLIRQTNKLYF